MYIDPAGQFRLTLPLGWGYDPGNSGLITVLFRHWKRPGEMVSVRVMPTLAPISAPLEQWHSALKEHCFPPRVLPFTQHRCGNMPAAMVEVHESEPEAVHRRILVVHGTRLDIFVEHRTPEPSTGPLLSDVLAAIGTSLDVPTNRFLPTLVRQEEVERDLQRAREALQKEAWGNVLKPAQRVQQAMQSAYLHSVIEKMTLPQIPAIVDLIEAYIRTAQAARSLWPLRDAEHLTLRTMNTLHHHPLIPPQLKYQLGQALEDRLSVIVNLQVSFTHDPNTPASMATAGVSLAECRIDALLREVDKFAASHPTLALRSCELAVEDFFTVMSAFLQKDFLHVEQIPSDFLQKLLAIGATTPDQQVQLAREIVWQGQLYTLQRALERLSTLRIIAYDVVGSSEASKVLVEIAEELNTLEETSTGAPSRDQKLYMAQALITHAISLLLIEDDPSIEKVHEQLDRAQKLLDTIGEEGALRAELCRVRAGAFYSERRLGGAIETIDRGLRAAAAEPELSADFIPELKTIKSLFLVLEGRLQEARQLAAEVVSLPERNEPLEWIHQADYYLNLAIADYKLGNVADAETSLVEALRRRLQAAPFSEGTLGILTVAAQLYENRDFLLGYQLILAAAATLDARRATITSDLFRVGFDESIRHREIYGDLVRHLIEVGAGSEAIAAADHSRARALIELLADPVAKVTPTLSPLEQPSLLKGDDVRAAFLSGAEYIIRSASAVLKQLGAPPALLAGEAETLVQGMHATALMIQPVGQRVVLLLIRPSGEFEIQYAPRSLDELLALVDRVHETFYIYSVPRGGSIPTDSSSKADDDSLASGDDKAFEELWEALIGPVHDSLVDDGPLILVPYREFALVPFALLRDPQGCLLIERHALTVTPSLATLRVLHERGPWSRSRPVRAYVVGDPAIDPATWLDRLPYARREVEAVAARLRGVGVSSDSIILRVDQDAHEESYRREALGCDLVHLSCHAQLEEPAYTSRLFFAPYKHYDGLLLASEIAAVALDDALVFLAACETGQGRASVDGVIGLGRAFLEAGARAVILSLWKVEDAATAVLSAHFYSALFDMHKPRNAAEALRVAMLTTRADLEAGQILGHDSQQLTAHPANWAPFIILGDSLSILYQ
jgi:CHAT domain-containing protein